MRFVCLFYGAEEKLSAMSEAELAALQTACWDYDRKLKDEGYLVLAQPLQSVRGAKSVRPRRKPMVTDGAFAETKEQWLGFVLVEVAGQDEAVVIAAAAPLAQIGTVEVRPAMTHPLFD